VALSELKRALEAGSRARVPKKAGRGRISPIKAPPAIIDGLLALVLEKVSELEARAAEALAGGDLRTYMRLAGLLLRFVRACPSLLLAREKLAGGRARADLASLLAKVKKYIEGRGADWSSKKSSGG